MVTSRFKLLVCFQAFVAISLICLVSHPAHAINVKQALKEKTYNYNGVSINTKPLKKYYKYTYGNGIWTTGSGLNKRGAQLLDVLKNASSDGLQPRDYISALPKKIQNLKSKELQGLELYLSQSFWQFGRDLYAGRSASAISDPDIVINRKEIDIQGWLRSASRVGPKRVINDLRPKHPQYLALRKLLKKAKGKRAKQIAVNMERWRWLPRSLGNRYVMVNSAGYEVMIFSEGKITDRRKVIVGKPEHKTPMFSHKLQYAEFNPTWTVPKSIASEEMLPRLRKDPNYLKRNNYKLYKSWKKNAPELDAKSINWNSVKADSFPYRIVQAPGGKNALGQVKFLFPNRFDVYLHDTPAKKLFSNKQRDFSHGCIRVENPLDFAQKLFGSKQLTPSTVKKYLSTEETQRVNLKKEIPIHLVYFTTWVEDGKPVYYRDIYGLDKMVARNMLNGA